MEKLTWTHPTSQQKLTKTEKLSFIKSILSISILVPPIALKHFVLPPKDSPGPARAVVRKVLKIITSIPIPQQLAFFPERSTSSTISKFCNKHHLSHRILQLNLDDNLHFIGPEPGTSSRTNFLLYFHGGGYLNAASSSHVAFAFRCATASDSILAMLEYTLSPEEPCPRQLEQAVEALHYVLRLTKPENVILAGDSAGGHLITGLLSWIMHPNLNPDGTEDGVRLGEYEKFRGVCLISPMLSFDWGKDSYTRNAHHDYLSADSVFDILEIFKPESVSFAQALEIPDLSPADAPEEWWANMPVERMLVTVGSWEVFFDSAVGFVEKVSRDSYEGTKLELVVGWREYHDAPVVDPLFWLKEGTTSKAIVKWMGETGSKTCCEDYDSDYEEPARNQDYFRVLRGQRK